jgi:hypothetical protein
MVTEITRLEDVRPGDLYLGPIGGWVGVGVSAGELLVDGGFRVGKLDVRHIGVVVDDWDALALSPPRLAQAMPGGAEIVDMTYDRHWSPKCAYARLPEDYPGQAEDAAAIARLMVESNVAYSPASYPALAAWHWGIATPRLEKWIGRRQAPQEVSGLAWSMSDPRMVSLPVEAICSVFADQAWSLTGKKIFDDGRPHQCVTPSQLGQRLLFGLEDVIWGWPSGHPYP